MPSNRVTEKSPWHIVLVVDDSDSMKGEKAASVNEAIEEMIAALVTISMGYKSYFKVSLISFGSRFQTLAEAVRETELDKNVVASFCGNSGSTNIASALDEAARILKDHPGKTTDFEPFVFLFSDGAPDNSVTSVEAANRITSLDLASGKPRIVTFGFGDVDGDFMAKIASKPELYKKLDQPQDIIRFMPIIGSIGSVGGGAKKVEESIMIF